jgi:hypothetical protein
MLRETGANSFSTFSDILVQLQVTFSEIKSCFKRSFGQLFPKITPDSALGAGPGKAGVLVFPKAFCDAAQRFA